MREVILNQAMSWFCPDCESYRYIVATTATPVVKCDYCGERFAVNDAPAPASESEGRREG
jgi:ribosomal protein L37AE/L43A